jgi:hypothetical protein
VRPHFPLGIDHASQQHGHVPEFKVEAIKLESGSYIQRPTVRQRSMVIPPLRDRGQADRLSAELRALLERRALTGCTRKPSGPSPRHPQARRSSTPPYEG